MEPKTKTQRHNHVVKVEKYIELGIIKCGSSCTKNAARLPWPIPLAREAVVGVRL